MTSRRTYRVIGVGGWRGEYREKVQKTCPENTVQAKNTKTPISEAISHPKTAPIPTAIILGEKQNH